MTDDVTENFCLFLNGLKYLLDFDSNFIASSGGGELNFMSQSQCQSAYLKEDEKICYD